MRKIVEEILNIIEQAGGEAYVVGGCVRDHLLGKEPKDCDITTSMIPTDVTNLFRKAGYNVVPTGIKHGTVTVFPKGLEEGFEITTYRTDGEYLDGRHPSEVFFTTDLKEDLSRRDLTINAMAFSPKRGFVDLFGGKEDLENKIIRTVGDPNKRIEEDALRMMRAIRFSAQLGAEIDESLITALKSHHAAIEQVSAERVHDELVKILMSDHPEYVAKLEDVGMLKHIIPQLHLCFLTKQNNPWHIYDVGMHTMKALENTEKDLTLRLAVLLHDIGKVKAKKTGEDGIDHFHGHAEISAREAKEILKNLRFTTKEVEEVTLLVRLHDAQIPTTDKSVRKFVNKHSLDDRMFDLLTKVKIADNMGQNLEKSSASIEEVKKLVEIYKEVKSQPLSLKDLAVNGKDVMAFGFKGAEVGTELRKLMDAVLQNPSLNTREELLKVLEQNKKKE